MKILLFEWPSVTNKEMANVFTKLGLKVYVLRLHFNTYSGDKKFYEEFIEYLEKDDFDFVFSINYFDMIAEACHEKRVKYIAWTYDSPTGIVPDDRLRYETNYIFIFDKLEAERYRKLGFENVWYLPLAVDCEKYDKVKLLNPSYESLLQSDISFVGRLYENNTMEIMSWLSDYDKAFVNALVDAQMEISGHDILKYIIDQEFMQRISSPEFNRRINKVKKLPWARKTKEEEKPSELIPAAHNMIFKLKEVVTNRERLLVLGLLAKHHHVKIFSTEKHEVLKDALMCGPVDYYTNMPKVFKYSKINMNITLRTIESAIPLRCLDIMGCGGLLMSNLQLELMDYFENEKDLLIYSNAEDALDKANYYLDPRHEQERLKISQNGYEKVKEYFNYPRQLKFIWEKAELGEPPF